MKEYSKISIADGVEVVFVPADRFKTNEIKISFCLPLCRDMVSANALTVSLLAGSSAEYPDLTSINKRLAYLYGADLASSVKKIGENQVMSLSVSGLNDRFSLGDRISTECIDLLLSLVFRPHLDENGAFYASDIMREQRLLVEKLKSEENEKRTYSMRRLEEIMFSEEPFAINCYGTIDGAGAVTADDVMSSWQNMLHRARVRLVVVGTADENDVVDRLRSAFSSVDREYVAPATAVFKPVADEVTTHTDRQDVKQGKLVLGFRVNMPPDDSRTSAMRAFCDAFGGGPYSRLFANVREKMSLCYYCSARYDRYKSCIFIQCGCEEQNMDKAVTEILNQLEEMKKGNFATELTASRIGLSDAINSAEDDSGIMLNWYSNQITDDIIKSPHDSSAENDAVTADQVLDCAHLVTLDTIYKLCSTEVTE